MLFFARPPRLPRHLLVATFALSACEANSERKPDEAQTRTSSLRGTDPAPIATTGPRIEAGEAVFNFGEVMEGEPVTHVFKIKNTGTHDLLIEGAKGS